MSAMVYIRNDGPDPLEVMIGKKSVLLQAGQEFRATSNAAVTFRALKPMTRDEMALHQGGYVNNRLRYAED